MKKRALPSREEIRRYLGSFDFFQRLGRSGEGEEYLGFHLERFIKSMEYIPLLEGHVRVLELGAAPYFMTLLIEKYLGYSVTTANFFGDYSDAAPPEVVDEHVSSTAYGEAHKFPYRVFNIERDPFPYEDGAFDLVLCCEILEHLAMDPSHTLKEAHRVLKPGGYLFISTPNVLCLENVRLLLRGKNVYQNYSGYGIYGRHSREYTPRELEDLLREHNFEPTVHVDDAYRRDSWHRWLTGRGRLSNRRDNLFAVGKATGAAVQRYPSWLYSAQWGRKRALPDRLVMGDNDAVQLGPGWYELENWPPGIRWTASEAVAVLNATSTQTILRIRAHAGPGGAMGRVVLNAGAPQPFSIPAGGPSDISVALPKCEASDGQRIEIRIFVDNSFVPAHGGGSADDRRLGMAVECILLS